MSKKIFLIADFFYRDFTGGAELNDFSLVERFTHRGYEIVEVYCKDVTIKFLQDHINEKFIVGNFVTLDLDCMKYMINNITYVIYEHDHKYLMKRNPISYRNFIAPASELANVEFYECAKSTICLTELAKNVFMLNTGLENVLKVGASVWRDQDLDYILSLRGGVKSERYAIMDSDNPIKKRHKCIEYCEKNGIKYDLISDRSHQNFLQKLSKYKGLIFMTGHLETCCRLVVEAKMLDCDVITTTKLIGAASEDWFELKGDELVEAIREVSKNSVDVFLEAFGT